MHTGKKVSVSKMEPHRHRRRSYKPIHAKERRNGPPSANQDPSTQKQLLSQRNTEMAHPVPPRPFYPEAAMLSQPSTGTRPPPLVQPFLLAQSISSKVIARSNITNPADFD